MMNVTETAVSVLIAAIAGVTLGATYFGGLWMTVRRLPDAAQPTWEYLTSLLLRMGILLIAFGLILAYASTLFFLSALVSFLVTRLIVVWYLGSINLSDSGN